jgi:ubiquinone/menaquinone biosynthesis C-methylase UbiE
VSTTEQRTDTIQGIRTVYEEIAGEYDERIPGAGPADDRFTETERAYLRKRLGSDDDVLELGCGTGRFVVAFGGEVRSMTGLDLSPAMLEQASRKGEAAGLELQLVEGDMRNLPFDDDSFDVVYSMLALMHLPVDSRQQVFLEAARVLRPGGRMIVGVKNANFERLHEGDRFVTVDITDIDRQQLRFTRTRRGEDLEAPWASFSPDDLERLFATAGLHQINLRGNSSLSVWLADSILADPVVSAVIRRLEDLLADSPPLNWFGYHLLAEAVKPARS